MIRARHLEVIGRRTCDRFPLIAGLGFELVSGPGPARGTWAFEAVATGIVATPRPDDGD